MFITFADIMRSQPETFQNTTLVTLGASAQALGAGFGLYQSASTLAGRVLNGQTQQAQSGQAATTVSQGQQLITAINSTASMVNSTSQVMAAAKKRLTGLVASARAERFIVDMATGMVYPTDAMLDATRAAWYIARAKWYISQIQTVVFQVNAHDLTVKASLAKTALDLVNFVTNSTGSSGGQPAGPTSPSTGVLPPTTSAMATTASSPTDPRPGFGLASAGTLGVDTAGGRAGLGLPGASALSGGSATGVQALAGAGSGGPVAPLMVGRAGGAGSAVGLGGAPIGAVGAEGEERQSRQWRDLTEDEELFAAGDVPDTDGGVLS